MNSPFGLAMCAVRRPQAFAASAAPRKHGWSRTAGGRALSDRPASIPRFRFAEAGLDSRVSRRPREDQDLRAAVLPAAPAAHKEL